MSKMSISLHSEDDAESVTLQLNKDGDSLGYIILSGADLEQLAGELASARASLSPQVALEPEPGFASPVQSPIWKTALSHSAEGECVVLALRHPGLGWLSFRLPHNAAAALASRLKSQAKQH